MTYSLFIENHPEGIAFYINGDLQFNSADEAIYHEYLVIPALALATQRFPDTPLKILICGGGDGLAARDGLRFSQVGSIDLVDYSPAVLELGKTTFAPYNQGSLAHNQVTIHTQEAFSFLKNLPPDFYHVIISDFTYPTCVEDTAIYSQEFFLEIARVLKPQGILSTNGVSPQKRPQAYWCLYQTILAAGLNVKPLQIDIPSFRECGYGIWGFFLASALPLLRTEILIVKPPTQLKVFNLNTLRKSLQFPESLAQNRQEVYINTLAHPQLYYYLLNPTLEITPAESAEYLDFLEIEDFSVSLPNPSNPLQLEAILKTWLDSDLQINLTSPLPVQHPYHSPQMNQDKVFYLQELLASINEQKLLEALEEKARSQPTAKSEKIWEIVKQIKTEKFTPRIAEFVSALSLVLLLSNLSHPDAVFAKGSYASTNEGINRFFIKLLGFTLITGGVFWFIHALIRQEE
jgi:spermidine synthase